VDRFFRRQKIRKKKRNKAENYVFSVIQHHLFAIQKNYFRPLVPFKETFHTKQDFFQIQ
jgi:hypothetical protein